VKSVEKLMIDFTTKKFTQASVRDNDDRLPLQTESSIIRPILSGI